MSLSHRLRSMLTRFRRTTPGLRFNRFRRGYDADPWSVPRHQGTDETVNEYDPIRSMGYPGAPQYESPESFGDIEFRGSTPPEQLRLPDRTAGVHETPVDYDAMLITEGMMDEITQRANDHAFDDSPHGEADTDFFQRMLDLMTPSTTALGHYDGSEMSQELFDQQMAQLHGAGPSEITVSDESHPLQEDHSLLEAAVDQHAPLMEDGQAEEMALEDAVEQQFNQMMELEDPMPTPEEVDPIQDMQDLYDQQMQQLLNPFQMPGPMGY